MTGESLIPAMEYRLVNGQTLVARCGNGVDDGGVVLTATDGSGEYVLTVTASGDARVTALVARMYVACTVCGEMHRERLVPTDFTTADLIVVMR